MKKIEEKNLDKSSERKYLAELTSNIVSSYVSNNTIDNSELPKLISEVYESFYAITNDLDAESASETKHKPAVPIKKSIADEYLICLEDGKKFKSLKRHLSSHYGLTPDAYRKKWGLPSDYPMVSPSYAKARSRLAKKIGLGRKPLAGSSRSRAA